jgi:uncharacterized protein (DUF58 family)
LRETAFGRAVGGFGELWFSFTREGRVVVLVALFAGLFGLEVRTRQAYLVWCALTGVLVASLVVRRAYRLHGVEISAEAPRAVAVGEDLPITVRLANGGPHEHLALRIAGPLLPWDGQYVTERAQVPRLRPGGEAAVGLRVRFAARGEHHLDPVVATATVPFGLVASPAAGSGGIRFLVVPRVAAVDRLRTPLAQRYQPGGVALASRTGESLELTGLRPYRPGDPVRDLHARRWARLGAPVVREYRQEYFTRIGVVVDTDARAADEARFEAALSLAAGVVACLGRGEALIDLLVVGPDLHRLTLGRSLGFLPQALDLLGVVEPGPRFAAEPLERRLEPHLVQLSCVVLVALGWDAERQRFADGVVRAGVGCRVLEVTSGVDEDVGVVGGADLTRLSAATIVRSPGVAL